MFSGLYLGFSPRDSSPSLAQRSSLLLYVTSMCATLPDPEDGAASLGDTWESEGRVHVKSCRQRGRQVLMSVAVWQPIPKPALPSPANFLIDPYVNLEMLDMKAK